MAERRKKNGGKKEKKKAKLYRTSFLFFQKSTKTRLSLLLYSRLFTSKPTPHFSSKNKFLTTINYERKQN